VKCPNCKEPFEATEPALRKMLEDEGKSLETDTLDRVRFTNDNHVIIYCDKCEHEAIAKLAGPFRDYGDNWKRFVS